MAHFAKLNHLGHVVDIITVDNSVLIDDTGNENEEKGIEWLVQWSNGHQYWAQTSYNTRNGRHIANGTPFRMHYARKGGTFDKVRNMFIDWKPFDGDYVLDEDAGLWYLRNFIRQRQGEFDTTEYQTPNVDFNSNWDWDPVNWTWIKTN